MAQPYVYFVGSHAQVAHHAKPLEAHLDVGIVDLDQADQTLRPGDVAVFVSEHFEEVRETIATLKQKQVATLYAIDGILEWRNAWDNLPDEKSCPWTMRPCLSDKVAAIGPSQARTLQAWGNGSKVELIGVPRFDALWQSRPTLSSNAERIAQARTLRVMVVTAKCPGFTPEQVARTRQSLADLRDYFAQAEASASETTAVRWEVIWRLTAGLDRELGVATQINDLTGADFATQLASADLVISTASTAMLEAMIASKPVALLDSHNTPAYVPTAWRISSADQIDGVLQSMRLANRLDRTRFAYQDQCLSDSLWSRPTASARLAALIRGMHQQAAECLANRLPLKFPQRMVAIEMDQSPALGETTSNDESYPTLPAPRLEWLYPEYPELQESDVWHLRSELAQARRELRYVRTELSAAHQVLARWQRLPLVSQFLKLGSWWSQRSELRAAERRSAQAKRSASSPPVSSRSRTPEVRG